MEELNLSQSFTMGTGGLEHNLRIKKSAGVRQTGQLERRHLNEDLVVIGDKNEPNYVQKLIHDVVEKEVGDKLAMYNEKCIQKGHPERVKTLDKWIESQQYMRGGKKKSITREYIVQLGNKFTGSPFEIQLDSDGNMIDINGKKIKNWDTRKIPAYKDGKVIESSVCKRIKAVYRDYLKEFKKHNKNARIICASIHCDEYAGCHMHINVIWVNKTKTGIGIGLAETSAIKQQYEDEGIKCINDRFKGAQSNWRKDMKMLLKKVAGRHDIFRVNMHNKEKHRGIKAFKAYKDDVCDTREYLEDKEEQLVAKEKAMTDKEKELADKEKALIDKEKELADMNIHELYILKKQHPEIYRQVHTIHANYVSKINKNVNKSIDKGSNMRYNCR